MTDNPIRQADERPDDEHGDRSDSVSDPAADAGESGDWSGEGGATPDGPATDEDSSAR